MYMSSANTNSGNLLGMQLNEDPSGSAPPTDPSGTDPSGASPSGIIAFYKKIWYQLGLNKIGDPFDTASGKMGGIFIMFIVAFTAGVVVLIFFLCSQNLIYLTKAKNLVNLPTNIKKPPYSKGAGVPAAKSSNQSMCGVGGGMFDSYGAPYSFVDNPAVIPWIPCNYSHLRNMFGIKKWVGGTCLYSWLYGRKLLKATLGCMSGLPDFLKMLFAFPIMSGMVWMGGLVTIIFTLAASFQSSVLWSILGIILLFFPILLIFIVLLQHMALVYYLYISPFMTTTGRQHLANSIHKHKTLLCLVYVAILILLSPLFLGGWWTLGMIAGVLLLGFS